MAHLGMNSKPTWINCQGPLSLLPPTSSWDYVQNKIRLDASTKSETSWSCQQIPSWASGSKSHGRPSPTWSNPLDNHPWKSQTVGNIWSLGCLYPWETPTWSTQTCPHQSHQSCPSSSPWKQKVWGEFLAHRRRQSSGGLGKLTHGHCLDWNSTTEVWSHCSMLRGQSKFMVVIYFRPFLELDLLCQTGV
jgi:hypothetical protein